MVGGGGRVGVVYEGMDGEKDGLCDMVVAVSSRGTGTGK